MRIQRVPDIPHDELVIVVRKPGREPVVLLNARLVTEAQAAQFGRRIANGLDGSGGHGV
ncbi:hypothetical protein [Kitasatospora sp. A2-31]|uniref:hypothetical protein n=1 Tax=Kitasatospora sp. A2-31 TaxID=2916414 RepID=UPI001EE8874C|nr:hypothetical protein [Kitasatospora sp. A2-31]MCG6493379.1 hypothetical protein [Kitasatospora sp. A2-31]